MARKKWRQNLNYAHVHFRIPSDTKPFEYTACGRENFRIRKKKFAEKKNFTDTCGHGLSLKSDLMQGWFLVRGKSSLSTNKVNPHMLSSTELYLGNISGRRTLSLKLWQPSSLQWSDSTINFHSYWEEMLHFTFDKSFCLSSHFTNKVQTYRCWLGWCFLSLFCSTTSTEKRGKVVIKLAACLTCETIGV